MITFGGSIWIAGGLGLSTGCRYIAMLMLKNGSYLLCFYTGETSRLWWASVLLLSDPRQSVHTVRVPYQPSVFAPFCFKSAGLALVWASAVLLWFLALLYPKVRSLSIRRVHNNIHIIFPYSTDKLDRFYNTFKSIQFIFVRQSFFSRASPPLQLSTKLIVFKGIVFGKIGEPFLSLLHDAWNCAMINGNEW